jgi:arsenate reductase
MKPRVYVYAKCSTCRDALRLLDERGVPHEVVPIREQPPTVAELRRMLGFLGGDVRRLFNSSGMDYRAMGLKDRLPQMSQDDALELLSQQGNLVKRPFALTADRGVVGFKREQWDTFLG